MTTQVVKSGLRALVAIVFVAFGVATAWATAFIAYDLTGGSGTLWDATDLTGPTNPRSTVADLIDIEFGGGSTLYGLAEGTNPLLYRIDPSTGAATPIGNVGLGSFIFEGDLAYDPISGSLYGFAELATVPPGTCCVNLFRIDTTTGLATVVGGVDFAHSFVSMMSFDSAGNLWIINQAPTGHTLVRLDPTTAGVISEVALSRTLNDDSGGMDFDPVTGTMYGATTILFSINTSNGAITELQNGFSFLPNTRGLAVVPEAVPEPASLWLLGGGLAAVAWARRRRISRR